MPTSAHDLAREFEELHQHLTTDIDPEQTHQRIVDLVCKVVPGCAWAGITSLPEKGPARTLAHSAGFPLEVDAAQYELGEGPCLSAAAEPWTCWAPDLANETRWPRFVARVLDSTPVQGVLAFHLAGAPGRHALNVYSDRPDAFEQESVAAGALFAAHAGVLMAHAQSEHRASGLQDALDTSRLIGAASGMLMQANGIDQDAAFQLLRTTSNRLNRKLRDIAGDVTRTGELPRS